MARTNFDSKGWIPEETDSTVIKAVEATSAIERVARKVPMTTDTKNVPRSGGVDVEVVAKGGAYGEDESVNDEVTLSAKKIGKVIRIAEEDIEDSPVAILDTKKGEWSTSYARFLDNACLAVTAAPSGITVPFQSVYNALATTNADTAYTAGDNIIKTAGPATFESISEAFGIMEESDYFDNAKAVVIAHPGFKRILREIKDGEGNYIFTAAPRLGDADTILGYKIEWSSGAKTSATATPRPTGNPIMVIGNSDFLTLGVRSGPESIVIDGRDGTSALTDETLLKMRSRRAFTPSHEKAFAILEITAA